LVDYLLLETLAKRAMTSLNSNRSLRCFVGLLLVAAAVVVLLFCFLLLLLLLLLLVCLLCCAAVVLLMLVGLRWQEGERDRSGVARPSRFLQSTVYSLQSTVVVGIVEVVNVTVDAVVVVVNVSKST